METPVVMPPMGDAPGELILCEWYVAVGDVVRKGEPLFDVETDKGVVTVEALVTGKLARTVLQQGDSGEVGDVIAYVEAPDEKAGEE